MSEHLPPRGPDADAERALAAGVRTAFANAEPSRVPPFERLWSQAQRPRFARPLVPRFALAVASAFVLAAVLFGVLPELRSPMAPLAGSAEDDYRLALELAARFATPSPLDALAPPPPMTRGLPSLSEYRYPLLPEEITL